MWPASPPYSPGGSLDGPGVCSCGFWGLGLQGRWPSPLFPFVFFGPNEEMVFFYGFIGPFLVHFHTCLLQMHNSPNPMKIISLKPYY